MTKDQRTMYIYRGAMVAQ